MESGSFARGGQPRSVRDPDKDAYDAMIREENARRAGQTPPNPLDPILAAATHVLNGPRIARKELEEGHPARALVDSGTAIADLLVARSALNGIIKGQVKLRGPFTWRTKPWTDDSGAREWMGDKGIVGPGQPAHHWAIPQNGWGKHVPDRIKNQPINIKPMEDALDHIRTHGNSRKFGLPRYSPIKRYIRATPTWWKAANGGMIGHGILSVMPSDSQGDPAYDDQPTPIYGLQ